jgi:membrane-associated phospholipid phosphatase
MVFAVYLLVVRTYWGQRLDEHAFTGREVISDFRAGQANEFLGVVSVGSLLLVTVLIAAVAFARQRPRLALLAAGSLIGAVVCTEILKYVLLERPNFVPTVLTDIDNTYPSGHATIGMGVALAVLMIVPPRLRWPTALGAGAVGAAFGVAVVAAGWHRPSDVVGAYFVCLACAALGAALATRFPDRPAAGERAVAAPRIGGAELALLGIGLGVLALFGLAALTVRGIPWTSAGAGFLISSAAIVALAFATAGALAWGMGAATGSEPARPGT